MSKTLTYVLLGRDELSPVAKKAGAETEGAFARVGKAASMAGTLIAGAAIAWGAESIKAATNFQSAMEKVHTQAGASQASISKLSEQVLNLGKTAQQSPEQLAEALYHLKSVGMDDVDAMKALKTATDLAAVGGADLEATTNALAGAWRSGIKGAQSFGQTASTVNAIIGAGNMRMEDFVAAIGTGILPSAKTFGVSLQSVGAGLALMTDEGVPAVDAATRLRMSLSLLGAPSKQANKVLGEIGLTGLQLAEAMRGPQGIIGAITLLKSHLDASGLSASRQAQILSAAFGGGRSSSAILTLVNNLDVLKKKQEQINSSTSKYGDAVAKQRQTASAQFAILKSNLDVLSIRLGTALLPPLAKFAGYISTTALPAVLNFGKEIQPIFKIGFSDFVTGLTTIVKGFSELPAPVRIATVAIIALGIAMKIAAAANPWVLLATAIVLAVGIIVRNWKTIQPVFDAVRNAIMTGWKATANFFVSSFDDIRNFAVGVWHSIEDNFFGQFLIAAVKLWWAGTKITFQIAWDFISGIFDLIMAIGKQAWKILVDSWRVEWSILKPLFELMFTVIAAIFVALYKAGQNAWNIISTSFRFVWNAILKPAILALWNTFSAVFSFIIHAAASAFGWIPGLGPKLRDAARQFDQFRANVNNAINGIGSHTVSVQVRLNTGQGIPGVTVGIPPGVRHAAKGSYIQGAGTATSDSNLAWVSNGEYIVKASSVRKYGVAAMDAINAGRYASGGLIVAPGLPSAGQITGSLWASLAVLIKKQVQNQYSGSGFGVPVANVGSGVARWAPLVREALAMEGLNPGFILDVLYQMMTESGGNPNAINLWDSNAARGDPSRGLMQTIMSTFLAYHWPGTSYNIYDPLANIAAALNYGAHNGRGFGTGAGQIGSGHGYALGGPVLFDNGGFLPPRSATLAVNGTNRYEPVGGRGGNTYILNISPTPLAHPRDIGREVVGAIKEFEKGSGSGWRKP